MSLFTPAQIKALIDEAIKDRKWSTVIQNLILNIYEELHHILNGVGKAMQRVRMQNEYLMLRVDGNKSPKEAAEELKKKYAGSGAPPSESVGSAPAPVQQEQEAPPPRHDPNEVRVGADGEPLSPEDAEKEALMDQAIDEGIKTGEANPV